MGRWRTMLLGGVVVFVCAMTWSAQGGSTAQPPAQAPRPADPDAWQIPPDAATEKNPMEVSAAVLAAGKKIFEANCQRCHGPKGKGNGPDADPDHKPDDLTDRRRAARNPDGVMFYKIWNGRKKPKMPAFKEKIARDEVWTVIHYVKEFRKPAAQRTGVR